MSSSRIAGLRSVALSLPDLARAEAFYTQEWGPGRHGPGDNAFNYFLDPFGVVIEYTTEVEQIDDSYLAGSPTDWTWPPGRIDHWGISAPPSSALKMAQRAVLFADRL